MNILMRTQFGSHVYGTNLPTSDTDFKGIYIPTKRDLYLSRAQKTINTGTKENKSARNESTDIDEEIFSLQQYLKLLSEGQTVALDKVL